MPNIKQLISTVFAFFFSLNTFAQSEWTNGMTNPNANFYDTQAAFEAYWEGRSIEKGKGWKQFKRWEAFMEPRVYPSGEMDEHALYHAWKSIQSDKKHKTAAQVLANWTPVGPTAVPLQGNGEKRGVGRVNVVEFDPTNNNILWAGSPSGGLWKSIDGGLSWSSNTDLLPNLGVSDIAIHPNNPSIMYIATGDRDASDTYTYGILKSIDGGMTWDTTGLSFDITQSYRANRILIDPNNPNTLIASTREGSYGQVYRSTDAGASWSVVKTNVNFISMEFKPGDPNTIYAATSAAPSSARFYKSIDNGLTWNIVTNNLPLSGVSRGHVAVTNDNPDVVYLLFSASDDGFYGVYKSTDNGDTWTQQSTTPNLLGWATDGTDTGGQGWYDLALAVSPTDENTLFVGGVNVWKSDDGGLSWYISSHWYGGGGNEYMHADEHILRYNTANNTLYSGNDGGLYKSTNNGLVWTDISDGLQITQFYRLGVAQTDSSIIIGGSQDNGTLLMNGAHQWDAVRGGDGMECIVDHSNANIMYSSVYYGAISKSTDGGNSWNSIAPSSNGAWVTPYVMDPNNSNILFAAYDEVYKTMDGGNNWTQISSGQSGGNRLDALAIAPSDNDYVYIADGADIWVTTDGGASWANIGATVPNQSITYIAVHPTNPQKVWVTLSGYSSNSKVYTSDDAGASWTNLSTNLPNIPANCIVYNQLSPDNELFVGTDLGVYYTNDLLSGWTLYNQGLPHVIVNELEIHQNSNTLVAATYGRGIWRTPLPITSSPVADFLISDTVFCTVPASVNFTNLSTSSTSFEWSFGDGATSTSSSPTHSYTTFGTFDVQLIANGPLGADTLVFTQQISVSPNNPCPQNMASNSIIDTLFDCNGILYDDGGANGNYSDNLNSYITIAPTGATQLTLDFTQFGIEAPSSATNCNYDYIEIFDGADTNTTSLGQFCNSLTGSPGLITASGGALTIKLHSDQNTTDIGLEAFWNCSYPSLAPQADFNTAYINSCQGEVQFVDESIFSPSWWHWSFGDGDTSTAQHPFHQYTADGTYTVTLISGNSLGSDTLVQTAYVNISLANMPNTINASACPGDSITLSATGNNPQWYFTQSGGTAFHSGNDYQTVANTSVTYYVEDILSTGSLFGGPVDNTVLGNGGMHTNDAWDMIFDCFKPTLLKTVEVYADANFSIDVELLNASGSQLNSTTVNLTTGLNVLTLNFMIPAGTGYRLGVNGNNQGLYRNNEMIGYSWPIAVGNNIEVTGNTTTSGGGFDNWYYFYNWEVEEFCVSDRTPISLNVHPNTHVYISLDAPNPICVGDTIGFFANSSNNSLSYNWSTGNVTQNFEEVVNTAGTFTYTLEVTDTNSCTDEDDHTFTVINCENSITASAEGSLSIFPNPTNASFAIAQTLTENKIESLELFDPQGKRITQRTAQYKNGQLNETFDISHLANGIYILKVNQEQGGFYRKVIKQ